MPTTPTTIYNEQAIGSGNNVGNGLFVNQQAIADTTQHFSLAAKVENGAGAPLDVRAPVRIYYSTSPFDLTADETAITSLKSNVQFIDLFPSLAAGEVRTKSTETKRPEGLFLYTWIDVPEFLVDAKLALILTEFP